MTDRDMRAAQDASRQLLHDLRNHIGAIGAALVVAKRAQARQDYERALYFIENAEKSCEACRSLLLPGGHDR